jgi:hypothetical protein
VFRYVSCNVVSLLLVLRALAELEASRRELECLVGRG